MKQAILNRLDTLDYAGTEALNTLCSNLSFAGREVKKIVVTSCVSGEGKSFVSMQIMQNLARRGKRVALVDADLRRSFLVRRYDFITNNETLGLAHYLAGYCEIEDILYETNVYGACVIPAGRDVANPIPLLDAPQFADLLDYLAERFDLVLVDSPPVGVVIDAAEIAGLCDGAVLVVEYAKTRRRELHGARRQIEQASCPILGCVINKVTFDSFSSKKYYYKSYYNSSYGGNYYRKSGKEKK